MTAAAMPAELLHAARAPYRIIGRFAYGFARGKLAGDPAYRIILERGLLQGRRQLLDLGCGLGLLAAVLRAAERCAREERWPASWPAAPRGLSIRGIELMPRTVQRARRALGAAAEIIQGDIRVADFGAADAVAMLDVLHYIEPDAHRALLQRVHATLAPAGLLLLRVGDAAAGLRFRAGLWCDRAVMLASGHGWVRLHCRSLAEWRALLLECGFDSQVVPTSEGTPFANVLLCARPR
ncbi:MAG TPA: class I SAM-dependent methyltransferase [Steroidobacteraceae bacterium]|jgi:SAM-dependent methyltransferase|nr:class I SAM-dependent methyltransferase [Steroidobacteraceae bacterium]